MPFNEEGRPSLHAPLPSETDVFNALLERYQHASGKMLLVIEPSPTASLTAEDLAVGLRFLSDLILHAKAAEKALDLLHQTPTLASDWAFAHSLKLLQSTEGERFIPLDTAEVLAMGIGSPAWFEALLKQVRTSLLAAALGVSGVAVTGVVAVEGIGAIERAHARSITLEHAEGILRDKYVPEKIKKEVASHMFDSIEKLESTVEMAQRGIIPLLLPADEKSKQSLGGAQKRPQSSAAPTRSKNP